MSQSREKNNPWQKRKPQELTREILDLFSEDIEKWIELFKENINIFKKAPESLTRILIELARKWKVEEVIEILRDLEIMAFVSNNRYFYKLCLEILWFYNKKKDWKDKIPKENFDFIWNEVLEQENIIELLWIKTFFKILRILYKNWQENTVLKILKRRVSKIFQESIIDSLSDLWFLRKFKFDYNKINPQDRDTFVILILFLDVALYRKRPLYVDDDFSLIWITKEDVKKILNKKTQS